MAPVRTWADQVIIPTYPLHPEDVNPRFFELEGTLIYPYPMQDHLSLTRVDKIYQALFLENEFIRAMCIPSLGGRILSVYDKIRSREMFYRNRVIKPGLIALRGAWFSGGIEWNRGPQSHTVTSYSPVDVLTVEHPDGSASFVIGYTELNFRTGWEVRFTLHPGRACIDERVTIFNPTDFPHSYYFWNNTAIRNTSGTRFCYPMKAASDHDRFFPWPLYQHRDLRWLKNYPDATPVFAYSCPFDFFGVYDLKEDYGVVQCANHHVVPGKKAWTWGQSDAGRMSQTALTDDASSYIEVQSGPLRTQTDYAVLGPGQQVAWQEWWYPVAGLGTGFEYATKDIAVERTDHDGKVQFRVATTAAHPGARFEVRRNASSLLANYVDLTPAAPAQFDLSLEAGCLVDVQVAAADGRLLAEYQSPLEIPDVQVPTELHTEWPEPKRADDMHERGVEFDRLMDRVNARTWYRRAIESKPSHVRALVALARLDVQAGLYEVADERLASALARKPDDGPTWYLRGIVRLRQDRSDDAFACGIKASAHRDTESLGLGVAARAKMRQGAFQEAFTTFSTAYELGDLDRVRLFEWMMLAMHFSGESIRARSLAKKVIAEGNARLVPRAVVAMVDGGDWKRFATETRTFLGEFEFAYLELGLCLADLGLFDDATSMLGATLVDGPLNEVVRPLPLYHVAYYTARAGKDDTATEWLHRAQTTCDDYVFPSQVDALPILEYAIERQPADARAHLYLGNLLAGLGRLDDAVRHWKQAVQQNQTLSVAFRNLGIDAWKRQGVLSDAADWFRQGVLARPSDQVMHRDLANVLITLGRRREAISLLKNMSPAPSLRNDVTTVLARAYLEEHQCDESLDVLETATYSNWEGDIDNWLVFVGAHVERGRERLKNGDALRALDDFEAALTYPEHLHVGRPSRPREAKALYWKGCALAALNRTSEARVTWQAGAAGAPMNEEQRDYISKCAEQLETES